jgi:DNA-binding LacI/PurR family transcriptional regulator
LHILRGMKFDQPKLEGAFEGKKLYQGFTLDKVAELSGTSRTTVVRVIEAGRGSWETVDKVAKVLGFKRGAEEVQIPIPTKPARSLRVRQSA